MRFALALFFAGILSSVADAQPMQLDPEAFGTLPVTKKQALVSNDTELGDGFVPARDYRRGPIRIAANATGRLDLMYANGKRSGCTAVLISPSVIMTNAHCVPQNGPNRVTSIVFQTGFEDLNRTKKVEFLQVDPSAIEYHPSPVDTALLRLVERSRRAEPIKFQISDPEAGETLFIVGHPKKAPKHVSLSHCFAADEPIDGVTMLHRCNTYGGNSGSFIFSLDRPNTVVGLHKWGATDGARYNMGTRMTRIASISPVFSEILGQDYVPLKPAPPKAIPGEPISMVEACDRYAAHPQNPDNPPSIVGADWNDIVTTDAIAICDAAVSLLPKHARATFNLARAYHKDGQYEIARNLYEQGAKQDYAASYNNLAVLFDNGLGVDEDPQEASRLYEKAADLGHPSAALQLGNRYRDARGKTRDYDKAMSFYEMAYERGDMEAAAQIAWLFDRALGVPEDDAIAKKWYNIAAQSGVAWANNNIGVLYKEEKNYSLAKHAYERALALGDERYPNWNLAKLYENGWGVPRDYDRAEEFYREAAAAGHPDAQRLLGDMYRDREDGNADPHKAVSFYREAADAGDKEAFAKIGHLYARKHVELGSDEETYEAAVEALEVAVEADITWAKRELGRLYRHGYGVPENKARAVELFQEAIAKGSKNAKIRLADMYLRGEGLPVDGKRALRMLEEAEAEGDDWARGKLIALLGRMPWPESVLDKEAYDWDGWSKEEQNAKRLEDGNFVLAWAQVVGAISSPILEEEGSVIRFQRLNSLRNDLEGYERAVQEMHEKARILMSRHIEDLESRPEDGWLWGGLPHAGSASLHQVLYAEGDNAAVPSTRLTADERKVRNRLLTIRARESAQHNPEGPKLHFEDGSRLMTIRDIQAKLKKIGFAPGSADGQMGPSTRRAISAFQRKLGMDPTGQPDAATLFALRDAGWSGFKF